MPNIFTDCTEAQINAKLAALSKCHAMITARMRYFYAKLDFIAHGNTMEELRELYVSLMFVHFCSEEEIQQAIKDSAALQQLTVQLQINLASILAIHRQLLGMIDDLLQGREPDGLRLCAELAIKSFETQYPLKGAQADHQAHLKKLHTSMRQAQREGNIVKANKLRDQISASKAQYKKGMEAIHKFDKIVLNSRIFEDLATILNDVVFGPMESKFREEFICIQMADEIDKATGEVESVVAVTLTSAFKKLHERNKAFLAEVKKRCIERHKGLMSGLVFDEARKELEEEIACLVKPLNNTSSDDYLRAFRNAYKFRAELSALDKTDAEFVARETKWLAEQAETRAKQKQEEERQLQAAAKAEAAKMAEEAARIKQELVEKTERDIALKKRQEQEHKEQLERDKAAKEAALVKAEVEKRRKHIERIKRLPMVKSDSECKTIIRSNITIPMELFLENINAIHMLFAFNTKRFAYTDARRLIIALGGELKEDTGSSHKTIIFDSMSYQEFDVLQQEQETVASPRAEGKSPTLKATLVEPHGSKVDWVTAYNLDLLRDAISSILPENWQAELDKRFVDPVHTKWSARPGLAA